MDGMQTGALPGATPKQEIRAAAAVHDRDGSFPFDSLALLRARRLFGLTAAIEDGGSDANLSTCAALVTDVAEACPSTALVLSMQLIHVKAAARSAAWPAALRARIGRDAVAEGALVNALRVEPELGSPLRGGLPATIARRTETGWSLSGRKIYSTGAPGLTWMVVWARTDDEEPRVGQFLVPARSFGVRIEETWSHLGLRASGSHDVVFEDVAIPLDHAVDLRRPQDWGAPDPGQTAWNTLMIAALYTGVATAARDWLLTFLKTRTPTGLGAPLSTLPRVQEAVGEIDSLLSINRRLISSAAADHDAHHDRGVGLAPIEAGLIKTAAAENAIRAVEGAVKLTGNHGLARANPLERHLRDVLCARIHTPQADSALTAAGRSALL